MNSMSTTELAHRVRIDILHMCCRAKAAHIGSSLSMADILAVLYGQIMQIRPEEPSWPNRDRFILSKGHGAAGYFAMLAESGFFPIAWLDDYCKDGGRLAGHIVRHGVPGVELSTGSLGHGLPVGCGLALAARADGRPSRVFVMLSDGECDEGSNWEAVLFAAHHRLDNLVVIVDYNKIQSFGTVKEVLDLEPFADKWSAFGWSVQEADGHDHAALRVAFETIPWQRERPSVILAHTIKGKGVSFMENKLEWHYRSPNQEQLAQALAELEKGR